MNLAATSDGHTEVDLTWDAPADPRTVDPGLQARIDACRYSNEATPPVFSDVALRLGATAPTATTTRYDDGNECDDHVITGYRVDVSETGTSGWTMVPPTDEECTTAGLTVCGTTFTGNAFTVIDLQPAKRYYFRVSTVNIRGTGEASDHESAKTDDAGIPTEPGGLVAQADGPNTITLCWYDHNALDPLTGTSAVRDEGLPVLGYRISYVEYDAEGEETDEKDLVADTRSKITTFTDPTTLPAATTRTYRVRAITLGGESNPAEASATTPQEAPAGVTVTPSYDSATMMHSITVAWTAPGADSAITGYDVQRAYMMDDGNMSDWMDVDPAHTGMDAMYMDSGLMAGTMYYYQVRSIISTVPSAWSDAMSATTHDVPDMPTGSAMADSDSQITVSWTAPADNGSAITGYALAREMGEDTWRNIAFTDEATWWNLLNCEEMNDAIPAGSTPAPGSDDPAADPRSPYCYMYGGLSADAKTVVDSVFADRGYGTITGTSYMDMGLDEMTDYAYRVKAANAVGAGDWSDEIDATTLRSNVMPTTTDIDDQMIVAGEMPTMDLSMYFSDADEEDATLSYTAMSDMTTYVDVSLAGSMLTIDAKAVGSANITVTATDGADLPAAMQMTASQTFMVTVASADTTLGAPTMVEATVDDSDPGAANVTVTWTDGPNAAQHAVILFDSNFDFDPATDLKTGQTDGMTTFLNVASGDYTAVVVAMDADFEMEIDYAAVTVP